MSTSRQPRFARVDFKSYKAFRSLSLNLEELNILVGPNNSGKSTILGAFRALEVALRRAQSRRPEPVETPEGRGFGYNISPHSLPISLENIHSDLLEQDSRVTFSLTNKNRLHLHFPRDGGCKLVPETQGAQVRGAAAFKSQFPVSVIAVPVLGPVEHKEQKKELGTVTSGLSTHRASRHFRSYWHHFPGEFEVFAALVKRTWPGMEIEKPEISNYTTQELAMYCRENRLTRELYWSGFGFQVWCQLLTHISRAREDALIIVDEPEVYLHPEIQRQLLTVLRETGPDVLLATHSTEIMSEADPSEIAMIDKSRTKAVRLRDVDGVQSALNAIGSVQNITLTSLARSRRVVFVEGDNDFRIIRRFARKCGYPDLATGSGLTALSSGGFGSWQRVTTLAGGVQQTLGSPLRIAAVYDRDYYCEDQIAHVKGELEGQLEFAHVHGRKEIENYLLELPVLDRAIARAVHERANRTGDPPPETPAAATLLLEITAGLHNDTKSQYLARRMDFLRDTGADGATLALEAMEWFEPLWEDLTTRLMITGGKEVLRALRERLSTDLSITLTDYRIIDAFHQDEIAEDMRALLSSLERFRH